MKIFLKPSRKALSAALSVVLFMLLSAPVKATLIGDTVNCGISRANWSCSPTSATVVDPGTEFSLQYNGLDFFTVDIGASSVSILYTNRAGLTTLGSHILTLSSLDFGAEIIAGISNFVSNVAGVVLADVTFTDDSVSVEFGDASFSIGGGEGQEPPSQISFDLVTRPTGSVPEPATLTLMGLGLAGLGYRSHRRSKSS